MVTRMNKIILVLSILYTATALGAGHAAGTPPPASPKTKEATSENADEKAEELKIDMIKRKYWAEGEATQMGVVQNRAYSKANKFSLGVDIGYNFGDPFLSNKVGVVT